MCLTTNDPTIKIAKENIIVFKTGDYSRHSIMSPRGYRYYKMKNNPYVQLIPTVELRINTPTILHIVDEGYHSYNHFHHALFVIPKGARYINGWFNGNKGTKNRVSSNIIYIGCAWNPLTWLRLLFLDL